MNNNIPNQDTDTPINIQFWDKPEITKREFMRLRSIALVLAARVESAAAPDDPILCKVRELRNIINGVPHA